ncbi:MULTISPECIES: N-acetyltransferase family protein [unclassified Marinovum]
MSRVFISRACPADAREMADLLNEVIEIGGTTAYVEPLSGDDIRGWMSAAGTRGLGQVARDDEGTLLGFQWLQPCPGFGPEVAQIASFVRVGQTGLGVGSKLFAATRQAAGAMGYEWIDATIRADNESGLTYYQSQGFETYRSDPEARLSNGQKTGTISKRFDLQ